MARSDTCWCSGCSIGYPRSACPSRDRSPAELICCFEFDPPKGATAMMRSSLVVLAALAYAPVASYAQGQPDFSKVEIKTTKIGSNFYTLEGQGGVIGVLA